MEVVNRGYISVRCKKPYVEWVNRMQYEFKIAEKEEANIYLVEGDFFDSEGIIKNYYKEIFLNELLAVSEDEKSYPEITIENFESWFELEFGTSVFDCESDNLDAFNFY